MGKKKIMIFAHYYHPDIASTGQILQDQAEGMLDEFDVTVICVVPSYGGAIAPEYKTKKYYEENINGVKVIRVRVPEFTKTNKLSRVKNIMVYFFGAIGAAQRSGRQDYVFTISQPPILGGFLGVCVKWLKHAKMIYCIQDFNPEQIMAVGYSKNKLFLGLMMWLDKFSCKRSNLVITVGYDMVETLEDRFHKKNVPKHVMINNWIDEKKVYPLPEDHEKVVAFKKKYGLDGKFIIMYSGNIGLYYDLENIIKVIKKFRKGVNMTGKVEEGLKTSSGRQVVFAFVGSGSVMNKLVLYKEKHHIDNVVFIPYQEKDNLIYSLNAGHVHWCVNAKGIKGVSVPSKCYGIMATASPILGVLEKGSEARLLIEKSNCGICCEPGDYKAIERQIIWFVENAESGGIAEMGNNGRNYLVKHLAKDVSIGKYKEVILNI